MVCGTLAATLAGVLWLLFPGWLRVRLGTDEVLTTLMMSLIGTLVLQYLTAGLMRNLPGRARRRPANTSPRHSASPADRECRQPSC